MRLQIEHVLAHHLKMQKYLGQYLVCQFWASGETHLFNMADSAPSVDMKTHSKDTKTQLV